MYIYINIINICVYAGTYEDASGAKKFKGLPSLKLSQLGAYMNESLPININYICI